MSGDEQKVHFIGGLPRAGSTLLCNVLAQNPRFHATATSGILAVLLNTRNQWHNIMEFRAMSEAESEQAKLGVLHGILHGYFRHIDRPVCFDKSRGWPGFIELAAAITGQTPKLIIPVRDLRDVLSSFEKLYRKTCGTRQTSQEAGAFFENRTVAGRCNYLCKQDQVVGVAVTHIKDLIARGWAKDKNKSVMFVDYDRFTRYPAKVIKELYEFLEEPVYAHDFENVKQVTQEDDLIWLFRDLHTIRAKIEPQEPDHEEILGVDLCKMYEPEARFWETKKERELRKRAEE